MIPLLLALALGTKAPHGGLAAERLARIDAVVAESIAKHELPGAVVLVGHRGKVAFRKAYGNRAIEPFTEPMTVDTVFDVASLTKPVATATSVMILIEEGKLLLSDPVVRFIPEFAAGGGDRAKVTIEHLLTHRAGFPPESGWSRFRTSGPHCADLHSCHRLDILVIASQLRAGVPAWVMTGPRPWPRALAVPGRGRRRGLSSAAGGH